MTLREGVLFAHLQGYPKVTTEMNCLEVVNLWKTRRNCLSVMAPILLEIEELSVNFFFL
jgi:hypothetical protein